MAPAHAITNGSAQVNDNLTAFANARENARRFHKERIGDVDPKKCFADYLFRLWSHDTDGLKDVYRAQRSKAAMGEASGTIGGFLVPEELLYDLMMDVAGYSVIRPYAHVVPMKSATLDLPLPDATTVPSALGIAPFWGGLAPTYGTVENATLPETEQAFRSVHLEAFTFGGYALASNQLVSDGGKPLDEWLRVMFARSIAWYDDWFFVNGTGVGCPQGMIGAGAAISVSRGTPAHFTVSDAQTMLAKLYSTGARCWLATIQAMTDLVVFSGWIPNGPLMLYGAPVFPTVLQPALGTKGDVILADPSMYVIGDHEDGVIIDVSRDEPTAFKKYQSVWRFVKRGDGQPMLNAAITIPDAALSHTVSPIVVLT